MGLRINGIEQDTVTPAELAEVVTEVEAYANEAASTAQAAAIATAAADATTKANAAQSAAIATSETYTDTAFANRYIFDSIKNLPNPNVTPTGTTFVAKDALFTAICVTRPDDATKRIWWPTQSSTPVNYNPTATNGASANGANRFGVYTSASNSWAQATVLGQAANGVSLTAVAGGAQVQWIGLGIQPVAKAAGTITAGQVVMSDANGLATPWDGDVAKSKLGICLLTTSSAQPPVLLFSQTL